jgi:hypothetical protein
MIIAAIASGSFLLTVFAIGVERRNEWKKRELRTAARQSGAAARGT